MAVLQVSVVKATQDVGDTKALWDAFCLLKLLFVERDVVVLSDVLERLQEVIFQMLFTLLLLNHDRPLEIQVVLFFKHVEERWVRASINAYLLELVAEMVLDRLLFELLTLNDDVVLALEHEAVDDEVLLFEKVGLLEEVDDLLSVDIIVALLDIHRNGVELGAADLLPLLLELLVLLHNVVVVKDSKAKLMLEHLGLQVLKHHVRHS